MANILINLKKQLSAHKKSFEKYAKLKRPRMMLIELSFIYEYGYRYATPNAWKNYLLGKTISCRIMNMILNCFDHAEDIETENICGLYFKNPFSEILQDMAEYTGQFENALKCYTNDEFIRELKACRELKKIERQVLQNE